MNRAVNSVVVVVFCRSSDLLQCEIFTRLRLGFIVFKEQVVTERATVEAVFEGRLYAKERTQWPDRKKFRKLHLLPVDFAGGCLVK